MLTVFVLALQALLIGFEVTVIDDRSGFTDADLFPEGVIARCGDIPSELALSPFDYAQDKLCRRDKLRRLGKVL